MSAITQVAMANKLEADGVVDRHVYTQVRPRVDSYATDSQALAHRPPKATPIRQLTSPLAGLEDLAIRR